VLPTHVGYTGGFAPNPSYEDVCSHTTGHAEAVEEFDPAKVSYEQLVELFWKMHNPTQVNRQGWDIGDQYRSAIFTHSDEQARIATDSRARAQERFCPGYFA
jgi:methionine-S-sulfoxide reductase